MAKSFSETTSNKFISIQYELEIYVKHDSITERGKGNVARFPIYINSQGQHDLCLQQQWLQLKHHLGKIHWNPQVVARKIYCSQNLNKNGTYRGISSHFA